MKNFQIISLAGIKQMIIGKISVVPINIYVVRSWTLWSYSNIVITFIITINLDTV